MVGIGVGRVESCPLLTLLAVENKFRMLVCSGQRPQIW
jgi:hypothetical protein